MADDRSRGDRDRKSRAMGPAAALVAALSLWPAWARPAVPPREILPPARQELAALAYRGAALGRMLRVDEGRLESDCRFAEVRDHLIRVRDEAAGVLRRVNELGQQGRLRRGGLGFAEVLFGQLATLIDHTRQAIAVADDLAVEGAESPGALGVVTDSGPERPRVDAGRAGPSPPGDQAEPACRAPR